MNITKQKQTHRHTEQTSGYHWGLEKKKTKKGLDMGRGLRGPNYYV